MAKAIPNSAQEQVLRIYEAMVGSISGVERKGASMPYTSHNGNMFSVVDKDGSISLRLPEATRDQLIEKHGAKLRVAYGTVLKEYIEMPEKLIKQPTELRNYFAISYEYAQSLKPKPTTRSKKAK